MPIPSLKLPAGLRLAVAAVLVASLSSACSVRQYALDNTADAIAAQGTSFASDDDPELIRDAAPFSLKLIESFIAQRPEHRGLLTAAAKGFTQYAYAFVQQDADALEDTDIKAAYRLRERARGLYRRARDYGLQGLGVGKTDFTKSLRESPATALAGVGRDEVGLLYWSGAAWAGWINASKDSSEAVADAPLMMALLERALSLDESYAGGAIHSLFITLAMTQAGPADANAAKARDHFQRAVALSGGKLAGPYVALAEAVSILKQDRKEFVSLLNTAIAINPDDRPEWRLENRVMQQRARWLLERVDKYFME